ncbi:protein BCAP isoform X1 [Eublepharis macularius]|uniref:Protein BCAP isoform X1 n=1 Tax=Eublepharis macularius TaxID=481883 RepID=A0AA97JDB9_EUBMA|nr:protein BCAP isoform X1 [Eublepharis macularius]
MEESGLPECIEKEPLKENWSSYNTLVNQHRTKMKELLPCLKGKSQDNSLEESMSESETKWLWEGVINEKATFRKKLQEAELAIGSAEMFLPSFKEALDRITKGCYVSASDMIKISMQADLLVEELQALKNMKGWLRQLLKTSKEKELTSKQVEDLTQKLTESESEAIDLKNEILQKERLILELSTQLQQEKADVLKASHQAELVQVVQNHLQCQIEKKEAENNQLRTKIQVIEKKINEWKQQVGEQKQQIFAEKERRKERKAALIKAASVQKQRAEHLEAAVENLISKIKEKEIQLSEALTTSNVWKSHHQTVIDEKNRLEVQVETLKKQMEDHLMELRGIKDNGRKSKGEILGKLNSVLSENENISLENTKLKASSAALEVNILSAEAELLDLHEEAKQQENLVNQYKAEVQKLETEGEELKARYEKVIHEHRKLMEVKDLEMDTMRGQTEAHLKELEHIRDLQKAAEGKLQKCQESLLSCQKSCVDKSKAFRELQVQVVRNFELGCLQYADDIQLLMDGQSDPTPDSLAKGLETVTAWLHQSLLKLNPLRTEVLCLGHGTMELGTRLPTLDKVDNDDDFLKHHSLEDENYTMQMKYEEAQRKLEEMELQNKRLENQLVNQEENLQKTELQFKQKLSCCDALTRQLEAALEDGRKKLAEEVEKISSKEQALQLKMLYLENQLRQKKEEHKQLARTLNISEKHHEVCLKELEHSLQKSENQNQSIQNYVQFLKTTYVTMFG